jgi:hypothetical protein
VLRGMWRIIPSRAAPALCRATSWRVWCMHSRTLLLLVKPFHLFNSHWRRAIPELCHFSLAPSLPMI